MLQTIDLSKKPQKAKLYLAKPNKQIIRPITEAYNINYYPKLSSISELSFSVPAMIERHHEIIRNPNLDIKDFYLIKYVCGKTKEWFIINQPSKSMSDSGDTKTIHAFSIGYELSFKNLRNYQAISFSLDRVMEEILADTIWTVGYIDPCFTTMYRSFEVDNRSILDFINEVATTFQALIKWDTENRTISFKKPESTDINKGFRVTYGNLLKGVEETVNIDQMATRFRPTGKEGLSINSVNPTGADYIEDFSYFIAGFQQDSNGNVLSHSPYISDGLCKALIAYNALIKTKTGVYSSLLSQLQTLQEALTTKKNELANLQTTMNQITDNLDIAQSTQEDTTDLLAQKDSQQALIDAKNDEIDSVNDDIASVQSQITNLQNEISIQSNFTIDQIKERSQFIIEKDWQNENYFDAQDLYDAALIEFDKIRTPQISVKIDMVNFFEILSEQKKWNLLNLGDIVTVYYDKLDINIKAKITEFQINHEDGGISLTISNVQEILDDEKKFINDLYKSISTSNKVEINASKWAGIDQLSLDLDTFLKNSFKAANQSIVSGTNESVILTRRGITVFDPLDPMHLLRINHGTILLSTDGGETVSLAINAMGVYAENIIGKLLVGEKLVITNENGSIQINGQNMKVFAADKVTKKVIVGDTSQAEDGSEYGIKVFNDNGETVFTNNACVQTDTIQLADNVDSTHRLKLKIYVDDDVIEVRKVKLAFSLEKFRAYETAASSGGASTQTSSSGGGGTTTSGASSSSSSASGGGSVQSASDDTRFAMNLATTVPRDTGASFAAHDHAVTIPQITHNHTVNIPSHQHDISHNHSVTFSSHSHSVSLPDHTHGIDYGIYESTLASNVDVYVDGTLKLNNNGSHYNSDQNNLDLAPFIQTPGWHVVELSSSSLGRINASLYMKSYVAL